MIASLPMYMRPETHAAYERYWSAIRIQLLEIGIEAPQTLSDVETIAHWQQQDMVFSQTCGMPYRLVLKDKVQLVGTPDFDITGCPAGYYKSVLIVNVQDDREKISDYRTSTLAVNAIISQSGFAAPQNMAKELGFKFENITLSGAHRASAQMVAKGDADIAAIDAVTWRDIQRYDRYESSLRIIDTTPATPGLPYICALHFDRNDIRQAVATAIAELTASDRDILGIKALIDIPSADYLSVLNP
ncbi:phosphate/phosphite/phosphonate ABC transporter substrate-binding protein [Amylibacter sp. SFDW26]|uniref:phosphate/phosphite/phosphonate ABC transporter substrate-binding protein n=1 Tax=Amylibacter sp. SFDW26 TaxID=2652722 RepID=UPI0012620ABB|nr:PhnD/SsuA/transferrin family substrate-binding protein [Amylibacter sp. SFDW26]KAB7615473.1 phosphate/phosphite/phosphonate ABC transporter substrate-binding protein [Amylibacter sp. SFDW26]